MIAFVCFLASKNEGKSHMRGFEDLSVLLSATLHFYYICFSTRSFYRPTLYLMIVFRDTIVVVVVFIVFDAAVAFEESFQDGGRVDADADVLAARGEILVGLLLLMM